MVDAEQGREQAKQAVNRFIRRFDESYRLLAYHAALPLVLTPELVNYLRNEFLRGEQVPWVAEVDLLLSDLCSQVGYELYAMDSHVRAYLLDEMKKHYGKQRMQEVAQVLISYVNYLSQLNPRVRQEELQAQRWAAMVYLGDEQCKAAVREIIQRLVETTSGTLSQNLSESGIRAELARLIRITEELSPELQEEADLLEYTRIISQILRSPETVNPTELNRSYRVDNEELIIPNRLLPESLRKKVAAGERKFTELEGFPPTQIFEFEVATIELKKSGISTQKTELIIHRHRQQAQCFIENLGNGVQLDMVAIPEGSFIMGSPDDEIGHNQSESPQHRVTIKPFFLGKYPVTQVQWQAVAALPQVNRELNPERSEFKGKNLPVERISWYDAKEFCDRLSRYTGKPYRLPSEAEWEYACRAGTTTPFHFGETITSDLANYRGTDNKEYKLSGSYVAGSKGIYRNQTIEVGSFGVANAFGLYDMHGQVWEWCADHWHGSYEGAPTDGSAWLDENDNDNLYLLRGGSWVSNPQICRAAYRFRVIPGVDVSYGFRVVCVLAARTL